MHMTRQEIMATRYGEMVDLILCLAIYNGQVKEKPYRKHYKFEEIIEWR